jgi:hypothetical protein
VHPQALRERDLCRQVRAAAEAVDTERAAWRHCRTNQRAIANDAGAEQRSEVFIVNPGRQRVSEGFVNNAEIGVATIGVPSGEGWRRAQVLRAAAAKPTAAVGAAKPRDTDAVAHGKPTGGLTEGIDDANHLMTRRDVRAFREQITLGQVQIGTTDPAAPDLDADLTAKGLRHLPFQALQRSAIDRPRLMHDPGVHHAILTSRGLEVTGGDRRFLSKCRS